AQRTPGLKERLRAASAVLYASRPDGTNVCDRNAQRGAGPDGRPPSRDKGRYDPIKKRDVSVSGKRPYWQTPSFHLRQIYLQGGMPIPNFTYQLLDPKLLCYASIPIPAVQR